MDIINKLNSIGSITKRRWRHINNGGCCVYASIIAKELKRLDISAVGIVSSYHASRKDIESISKIRKRIKGKSHSMDAWADNCIYFAHVGLEFKLDGAKYHYDTNGVRPAGAILDLMPIYKGRLTLSDLKNLAYGDNWNPRFNRDHIPSIEKFVKKEFNKKEPIDKVPKWFYNLFFEG